MKIQYLAVLFIIIILPMSLILSEYTQNHIETLNSQESYDSKLDTATYDAIKAFQLNTINNSTSEIQNSKIRDIEAAVNTFFNSISSNFNLAGYNQDILNKYVPALVFTMYDGIYIYTSYNNTLNDLSLKENATYKDGENVAGLKPYIFYSCRYQKAGGTDVVITYSLDNYIQVDGKVNNKYIHKDGYLYNPSDIKINGDTVEYRGLKIKKEAPLKEILPDGNEYTYLKINGVKYYKENTSEEWFTLLNGQKKSQGKFKEKYEVENDLAIQFFKEAKEFSEWFYKSGIADLRPSDARDETGNQLQNLVNENSSVIYEFTSNRRIFNEGEHIEDPESTFNDHRLAIIRYTIEKNLSIAIANYNNYTQGAASNFQMPNLTEEEWEQVMNNMSMISFLQGLNIGGKVYNGYSIINNNKNQEVVSENSLYIVGNDNNYHMVSDRDLKNDVIPQIGYLNIDFERKSITNSDNITKYYYPRRELGCYGSIVAHTNLDLESDNIYEYLGEISNQQIATVYYTALARERYSSYKASRAYDTYTQQFKE